MTELSDQEYAAQFRQWAGNPFPVTPEIDVHVAVTENPSAGWNVHAWYRYDDTHHSCDHRGVVLDGTAGVEKVVRTCVASVLGMGGFGPEITSHVHIQMTGPFRWNPDAKV